VSNEWFRFFNNLYTIAYAATGNVTPGTYGSATVVPQITVDAFGAITAITDVTIALDASQIVSGTIASARISGSYTGITGVGTLTVGTWNASAITTPYGGTGLSSYTAGDTLYYASGTALTNLAIGASTYINTSSGTAPQWTDPATITIGKATNIVGGAANRIAYQTAADTTGFIVAPTVSNTYLEWSGTAFQWTANPLGTVTSVAALTLGTTGTDLSSTVANPTTTPVITLNVPTASAANRGALSAADWTTFNNKAPGVTFTTNYIPYGQGTTTLNQSAGLQFDGTNMGIGRVPTTILDVYNGAGNSVIAQFSSAATNRSFIISQFVVSGSNSAGTDLNASGVANVNGTLTLSTNSVERMRLHRTGGVSIGNTTDPGATNLSVTGTIASASTVTGTALIPSSSTVPTNGMYLPAANAVGFATNSTNAIYINNSQNVGIGTASPAVRLEPSSTTAAVYTRNSWIASNTDAGRVERGGFEFSTRNISGSTRTWGIYGYTTSLDTTFSSGITFTCVNSGTVAERVRIDKIGNTYIETGTLWQYAPAPTSKAAAATLTAAEVQTGILNTTGTIYTITLPTGTALDTAFADVPTTNIGFDWFVVNSASGIITIAVGASGMTSVGTLTISPGVSAQFRLRRTAANTYVLYRLG
jgi:hypothetical protein